jgi:hypothetical protein
MTERINIETIVHKYLRGESNREELENALDLFRIHTTTWTCDQCFSGVGKKMRKRNKTIFLI